jgi:S1-C subfamily serine protease
MEGGGFAINEAGLVATSMHVIRAWKADDDRFLTIETNEGRYVPVERVVATDEASGVALVQLKTDRMGALPVAQSAPSRNERLYVLRSGTIDRPASFFKVTAIGADRNGTYLATCPAPGTRHLGSPVVNARGEVVGMVTAMPGKGNVIPRVLLINQVLAYVTGCK